MTTRLSSRRFWIISFSSAFMLLVLVSLGTWQVKRLSWKEGLEKAWVENQKNPLILTSEKTLGEDILYRKIVLKGTLQENYHYLYASHPTKRSLYGYRILGALACQNEVVLVDLGWSETHTPPTTLEKEITLTGIVMPGEKGSWWQVSSQGHDGLWVTYDLPNISKNIGTHSDIYFIRATFDSDDYLQHKLIRPDLSSPPFYNHHREYAMMWYGLAFSLIIIYLLFLRRHYTG